MEAAEKNWVQITAGFDDDSIVITAFNIHLLDKTERQSVLIWSPL